MDNQNQNGSQNHGQGQKKMYLANIQEKSRKTGEIFFTGSLCLDDVESVPKEHIFTGKNGKRYVKFIINPYKDGANQYGNTHNMAVDTFKPDQNKSNYNNSNSNNNFRD